MTGAAQPQYGSSAFIATPVQFTDDNIVLTNENIGKTQADGKLQTVCLKKLDRMGRKNGRNVPIYFLTLARDGVPPGEQFDVYWCPYNQGETLHCNLGNASRFMFTATMNGCTLGVGSQNGGNCRVAHANDAKAMRPLSGLLSHEAFATQQRQFQRNSLWADFNSANISLITPDDYLTTGVDSSQQSITTFAIHDIGKSWSFYTQRSVKIGGNYIHRGVVKQS